MVRSSTPKPARLAAMRRAPQTRQITFKPFDKQGRRLRIGDWVRLVGIPSEVRTLSLETRVVFRRALGETFKVEAFDEHGQVEPDLTQKVARFNWIWVRPDHLLLFRRKKIRPS
jgi:hypothetical protein